MPEKNAKNQQSLTSIYAQVVMKQTEGSFKDKYIAAMVALMSHSLGNDDNYDRYQIATKVYTTLETELGECLGNKSETVNPTDKLDDICASFGFDEFDSTELVIEVETAFDVSVPDADYSVSGLANAVLKQLYRSNVRAKNTPKCRKDYGPIF